MPGLQPYLQHSASEKLKESGPAHLAGDHHRCGFMDLPQVIGVKLKTWNEKTIVEGLVLIEVLQQPREVAPLPHQVRASPCVPRSGSFLASFSFTTPKFCPWPVVTDELAPLQVLKPHTTQRRHDEQRQDDFVGAIGPHHQEHHVEELPGL